MKEAQAELRKVLAQKREEERKKAAARMAKKGGQKAPKGGVKKRYRYFGRKCFVETDLIESQSVCRNKEFPAPVETNSLKIKRNCQDMEFPTPAKLCRNRSH